MAPNSTSNILITQNVKLVLVLHLNLVILFNLHIFVFSFIFFVWVAFFLLSFHWYLIVTVVFETRVKLSVLQCLENLRLFC